ncbi:MAG: peptidoglycan DD-metalloendopeptidase family protein [Anaerolineae bacterium]|nr:peptidoglycan DD-metalloendopeptidase family protein [Anaerolineae bacterium]
MQSRTRDLQGFAVLALALLAGAFILVRNAQPAVSYTLPGPTATATQQANSWQQVIQKQLVEGATLIPTHDLPTYLPPTLPPVEGTPILLQPTQVFRVITPTATRSGPVAPTRPGPTAVPSPTGQVTVVANNNPIAGQFSPPPEIVPLSMDPRDHFWFKRPVDSSANSTSIYWYAYGSDGPQNEWRIHHGLDMPNPLGKEVRAAGPGHVVWAADHYAWRENGVVVDQAYSYGNVVIVEHDFGYNGQPLYTLYAHLSVILAKVNDRVQTGDIIGLSGASGQVSGPHVHFEVRVEKNNYFYTRNPILWMAPYLDHGVVAGRVLGRDGAPIQDANISLMRAGRVVDTTTTYANPKRPGASRWNVVPDDVWGENFVIGDVPAGDYQVSVMVNGVKVIKDVTVRPATTAFIDFGQVASGSTAGDETPTRTR